MVVMVMVMVVAYCLHSYRGAATTMAKLNTAAVAPDIISCVYVYRPHSARASVLATAVRPCPPSAREMLLPPSHRPRAMLLPLRIPSPNHCVFLMPCCCTLEVLHDIGADV